MNDAPWLIVGQGLAGTCLAWEMWSRKEPFHIIDNDSGSSSRIAAGLINPITGKNFEPSKGIAESLPEALGFYRQVEANLGIKVWHPLPILRLAGETKEWKKIQNKLTRPDVAPWIKDPSPALPAGWIGGVLLKDGGRVDTIRFVEASRTFFAQHGCFSVRSWDQTSTPHKTILCDGASGLVTGRCGTHRCAKGEILTFLTDQAPDQIRVGGGGWVVPVDRQHFKAGSTYSWDRLNYQPTGEGGQRIRDIARRLVQGELAVTTHEAAIRPILRRSQPLIGPLVSGHWILNGLGSKGSLHAPATARRLADWLIEDRKPDAIHDIRSFLSTA